VHLKPERNKSRQQEVLVFTNVFCCWKFSYDAMTIVAKNFISFGEIKNRFYVVFLWLTCGAKQIYKWRKLLDSEKWGCQRKIDQSLRRS
jgi:hypothetical protein